MTSLMNAFAALPGELLGHPVVTGVALGLLAGATGWVWSAVRRACNND